MVLLDGGHDEAIKVVALPSYEDYNIIDGSHFQKDNLGVSLRSHLVALTHGGTRRISLAGFGGKFLVHSVFGNTGYPFVRDILASLDTTCADLVGVITQNDQLMEEVRRYGYQVQLTQ